MDLRQLSVRYQKEGPGPHPGTHQHKHRRRGADVAHL